MATRKQLDKQKKARALKKKKITLAKEASRREEGPDERAERLERQANDRQFGGDAGKGGPRKAVTGPKMHRPQGG
ncbi:MAG: hypothetical protein GY728_09590 [Phycisphaeraceae bacterium]|nr:hypothetical protein [Phycisphaeraceae bacterium]MCP4013350.1 hypothetical protein [Phycisphaeraceae bacterium]MCP4066679.1 hypothetical protein [Phycisphaeraceae bacterium]MCP4495647.1 hypothetical protein [Phycisphaeraceae bacterium]MCP4798076.1 hypothetical protein [Phycisphaeraceae bacterium]